MILAVLLYILGTLLIVETRNEEMLPSGVHHNHHIERGDTEINLLRDLIKNDSLALTLWELTSEEVNLSYKDEDCIEEISRSGEMISAFIVTKSLSKQLYIVRQESGGEIRFFSRGRNLKEMKRKYDVYYTNIQKRKSYLAAVKQAVQNFDPKMKQKLVCPSDWECGCISTEAIESYEEYVGFMLSFETTMGVYFICAYYVDPAIRTFLIISGLTMNLAILLIFARHTYVRNEANFIIFNIAICNVLILLVYLPAHYFHHHFPDGILPHHELSNNAIFKAFQILVMSLNSFSILSLSIQRYFCIYRLMNLSSTSRCLAKSAWRSYWYISTTWISAIFLSLFVFFTSDDKQIGFILPLLLYVVLYIFIFSLVTTIFNVLTRNLLEKVTEEGRSELKSQDVCSSRVIIAMITVFWITHIPYFIWLLIDDYVGDVIKQIHAIPFHILPEMILCYLFSSHACLNPIVLYKNNSTFKNLFDKYLFRCWHKVDQRSFINVNMDTLRESVV